MLEDIKLSRKKELYYTPEPEEFRVGFEYEVKSFKGGDPNGYLGDIREFGNNEWDKCIFPDKFLGYNLDKLFENKIRVRYLDREDIESFGFVFIKEFKGLTEYYEITKLFRRICEDNDDSMYWNIQLIFHPDINVVKIYADISDGTEDEKFFEGLIRNKSELKVVLKQLNII